MKAFASALIAASLIAGAAVVAMPTVIMVFMFGQSRVFFAMARDGLIPEGICKVHPKYGTPYIATILVGTVIALISGFTPIGLVAEMCNIGTLFAFTVATACVLVLRKTQPNLKRPFRCPAAWVIAPLAIICSLVIMSGLPFDTWVRFVVWSVIGGVIYLLYGARHSKLSDNTAVVPAE